jgi:hypothetical protein
MPLHRPLQPVLAALLAACVLLLGWAAYAPDFHEALCDHGHAHPAHDAAHAHGDSGHATDASGAAAPDTSDGASCAVTLFAAGCDAPTSPSLLVEPALSATRVAHFTEFMLSRTLRGPERVCGPPALA